MTALLALYMVNQLLLPGHVEHIAAFAGFRAAMESLFGLQIVGVLGRRHRQDDGEFLAVLR
jgi:hypothetical protein